MICMYMYMHMNWEGRGGVAHVAAAEIIIYHLTHGIQVNTCRSTLHIAHCIHKTGLYI